MKRALVLFVVVPALLLACGGDDEDDAGGATTAAAEDGGATTAAGGGTTDGTAATGDSDYCTALAEFKAVGDEYAPMMESGTATPEELEDAFSVQRTKLEALIDAAPPDIQSDLGSISGPTYAFIEALEEVDYDFDALTDNAAAEEALNQLGSPEYTEATARVDAYGQENCGITIGN